MMPTRSTVAGGAGPEGSLDSGRIAAGATPYVTVVGSTSAGHDYWEMTVSLHGGGGSWSHSSPKTCTIESSDNGTYQTQVVSSGNWTIPLNSGGCSTSLTAGVGSVRTAEPEPENKKPAGSSAGDPAPSR